MAVTMAAGLTACGGGGGAAAETPTAMRSGPAASSTDEPSVAIDGTEGTGVTVPVPDASIGTERHTLAIPLEDADVVVHGVAFYRPGPVEGSVIGGVSVVYDDSPAVRSDDGGVADADAIAARANPGREPVVTTIGGRTVLGWPDSEVVPAPDIPQEDRTVSRYVVLLDHGIEMVTFDDVDPAAAATYLEALAGAR